jgi:glycosyltransferase involved in cell wall biosynthesis
VQKPVVCALGLRGFPEVMGGIETHCQNLYPHVICGTPDFEIIAYGRAPYIGKKTYDYQGVKIYPLWSSKRKGTEAFGHTLLAVLHARAYLKPALLHFHAIGPALLIPVARMLGMHVVSTHHGHDYHRAKWGPIAKWALRFGEYIMITLSEATICVSREDATTLKRRYPRRANDITFIPNGVALPSRNPRCDVLFEKLGVKPKGYILAVGRLVPEKGFHDLIAALHQSGVGLKLVIAGGADHADAYSRQLREAAGEQVIFAGILSKEQLRTLYEETALFVLPSYHEGLPLVALEAILSKAPCLLSDIPANRQLDLPAQNYFPVGQIDDLAKCLALEDLSMLRVLDETFQSRYDWHSISCQTMSLFESTLASTGHLPCKRAT